MSLKKRYRETIQPKLQKDLSLTNIHEVPKVLKVTVNRGSAKPPPTPSPSRLR